MPVTITFTFSDLGDLYPQPTAMSAGPDAVTLSDGSILVAASDTPVSAASIFSTDGVETLALSALPYSRPAVAALASGGFAMAGFDNGNLVITGYGPTGTVSFSATRDFAYDFSNADIVQLTGGHVVTVCQADYDTDNDDYDIYVDIRSATGSGDTFIGLATDKASDTNPCAAALADGNVAIAWTHWNAVTASSEVVFVIYDEDGNEVKAQTVADGTGTQNSDVSIVATPTGFVLAYTDNEADGTHTDIGLAAFNMAGDFRGHALIDNAGLNDSHAALTTVSGNLLALTRSVFNGDNDIYLDLIDATTLEQVATRTVVTGPLGTQQDASTVTTAALGHIAVFWQDIGFLHDEINGTLLQANRNAVGTDGDDVITGDDLCDSFSGGEGDDVLVGAANVDSLNGQDGDDTLVGGGGLDMLMGGNGTDVLNGGAGNDYAEGGAGADILSGGRGIDVLSYAGSAKGVTVNLDLGIAKGGDAGGDLFTGFETLQGSAYADTLTGDRLANRIFGGNGLDTLTGGAGRDSFVFEAIATSGTGTPDVINDFRLDTAAGTGFVDRIDVSFIDAAASTGTDDAFTFIGAANFTAEGQIRALQIGADTLLKFNTQGTSGTEMEILLKNVTAAALGDVDFIL